MEQQLQAELRKQQLLEETMERRRNDPGHVSRAGMYRHTLSCGVNCNYALFVRSSRDCRVTASAAFLLIPRLSGMKHQLRKKGPFSCRHDCPTISQAQEIS